jgi:type II restriction enzyme
VDLRLAMANARDYRSRSQIARILTEAWGKRELYCPACEAEDLHQHVANRAVSDFFCDSCGQEFQLKAKSGRFGPKVANSAYQKKMDAIAAGTLPNYMFLSYQADTVTDLFVVPGFFIVPQFVERRRELAPTAIRHGWVGSNILLGRVPPQGRISIIEDSIEESPPVVRRAWRRIQFLQKEPAPRRDWIADILSTVHQLPSEFHLSDLYNLEGEFERRHPENRNIRPKIRQQVQSLRDQGILASLGKGRYAIKRRPG